MTMINFRRTGGPSEEEMAMSLELDSMPGTAAQRLQGLLDTSNFFDIPLLNDLTAGPGEHLYAITVVAGNAMHTVHVTDTSMPASIRPLVEGLTELARATTG